MNPELPEYSPKLAVLRTFTQARNTEEMAFLLETHPSTLQFFAENQVYNEFFVKKKSGGDRLIENPEEDLKELLRKLNHYLQNAYFVCRSSAAYAFQLAAEDEEEPRNILTNAKRHTKRDWLLNVDFQDFFHQVSRDEVLSIFEKPPFGFSEELANLLAMLTTHKGRLPMGAPTSPVLSNFATLGLDHDLLEFSALHHWTYTRFADDLTFSSFQHINPEQIVELKGLCRIHQFEINESKIKLCGPGMPKIVTGLKVDQSVGLKDDYLPMILTEIQKFAHAYELNFRTGNEPTSWLRKFEQQIEGHLRFVHFVMGWGSPEYQKAHSAYINAKKSASQFDAASWLDYGYWDII